MDDPDPGNLIFQIILLFVLILLNAFFAMSEIAIISLNDTKIAKMAEEGNKKAKQVLKLTADSSGFLSTIQIGVTLAGFLTSASASQTFVDMLSGAIGKISFLSGIPAGVINGFSVVVITLITSYFSLVLGELAPKRIAMQAPEKVSFKVVGILLGFKKITKPFVKILSLSTNGLVRLLGYDPNASEEPVTEEEIRMMVDVGGEKGVIEDSQKEMINNIFEFDDLDAGDIMTHRTDMTAAEISDPLSEIVSLSMDNGYSRIPVYDDDPDNIVGIAYVKDLLKYIGTDLPDDVTLRDIIREPVFVPESMPCGDLFKQMTDKHTQMAIVVDEFGGTAGIVTLEDVLESIVGNIQDEYDDEEEEISKIDDTTFTVDGVTYIDELDEVFHVSLPEGDYDTVGGFIISRLGYLPQDGEMNVVEYKNLRFTVLNVEDRRIGKVKIEILPVEEEKEDAETTQSARRAAGSPSAVRKRKKIKKKLNNIKGLSKRAQPFLYCIKNEPEDFFPARCVVMLRHEAMDYRYAVVEIHDSRHGVEGICLFACALCDGLDVLFLNFLDLVGDVHSGVHVSDSLDEVESLLLVGLTGFRNACALAESCKALIGGLAVEVEDIGQDNGVSKSVRHAVESAEVMGYSVDVADISSRERDARIVRSEEHLLSCVEILTVLVSLFEVLEDELGGDFCLLGGVLGVGVAYVGFNRVGQSVHTGGRSDVGRKTDCKLGIENCVLRTEHGIVERILLVGLGVGNNGGESGLGAGAGGGGNREERRQLLAYFELSAHLLNSLIRADDSCSRTLGAVHRRTAAESDEALAAVVKIELADFFDIVYRGVRLSLVIDDIIDTVCLETLIEAVEQVESGETLIGDDHHLRQTFLLDDLRQLLDGAGAGDYLGRSPVKEVDGDPENALIKPVVHVLD